MDKCPTCGRQKVRPGLTERQTQVLHTIKDYISEKGFSPSFRDIAERCGIQKSAAHRIVVDRTLPTLSNVMTLCEL